MVFILTGDIAILIFCSFMEDLRSWWWQLWVLTFEFKATLDEVVFDVTLLDYLTFNISHVFKHLMESCNPRKLYFSQ